MREARVLSYAVDPPVEATSDGRVETNLGIVMELLEDAAAYDPDFVCFPEYVLQLRYRGDGLTRRDVARPIPGSATDAVGEMAAELDSYVLLPMLQRAPPDDSGGDARDDPSADERFYNAVALVGPDSDVVGVAHKAAPTIGEMDEGTRPAEDVGVWDTEFGRVGVSVCWDERYPELGVRFAEEGADLVFHPTTATSSRMFVTWATYYGFHHVTCDKHEAWITTPTGGRIARTSTTPGNPSIELDGGASARVSFAEANTDCETIGRYQNRGVTGDIRERYGGKVAFHELPETGNIVVESVAEELPIADVVDEFGLESMVAYEARTRARVHEETDRSPLLPNDE